MKKLLSLAVIAATAASLTSCFQESDYEKYAEWREEQDEWLQTQLAKTDDSGEKYYETYVAPYDNNSIVYMHFHNDRELTKNNLVPLYTSTVDVKYHGRLYDDEAFDSSYLNTDSLYRTTLGSVIEGWAVALLNMHVGDSVTVITPWNVAYGSSGNSTISPYSHLVFDIKLKDIYKYETN